MWVLLGASAGETYRADKMSKPRRLICAHCGQSREWRGSRVGIGGPTDWHFNLSLWLQTPCCSHALWAYTEAYLRFHEDFVAADLRAGLADGHRNASLASRLPC